MEIPEVAPSITKFRDSEQVDEKRILEEFVNLLEVRLHVGSEGIVEIIRNANKARFVVFQGDFAEGEFLSSSLVTILDEELFDDADFTKQHFWIALGSLDGLNRLIAKNPAEHIIEYKSVSPFDSWNIRFGTWKKWAPIGLTAFPDIGIETSDAATGNYLTEWLTILHEYIAIRKDFFRFSPGKWNTIVVDFAN